MADKLQDVLASIIERLEQGTAPWRQPWTNGASPTCPMRADGQPFSGSNAMLLAMIGAGRGYSSPYWLTFQQCLKLEACVRKGSKGAPAILFKTRLVEHEQGEDDRVLKYLKTYVVFNADDVDAAFQTPIAPDLHVIPSCRRPRGTRCSTPSRPTYGMGAPRPTITAPATSYSFRRSKHSRRSTTIDQPSATKWAIGRARSHRLNREFGKKFGDQAYAFEELCAELAACLMGIGDRLATADAWTATPPTSPSGPASLRIVPTL